MDIIVGTAGHIDHGKTALVRALTGVDADRLPEEKARGITIDIGFAELELGRHHVGFVDVPGHERFVKNMLAGSSGIDLVMLVVSADEGVMPQTREHFDICRLLGIKAGLVALTKSDLADPETLELAKLDVAELVEASFLEGAPVIPVSSKTGEGVEELKRALETVAGDLPAREDDHSVYSPSTGVLPSEDSARSSPAPFRRAISPRETSLNFSLRRDASASAVSSRTGALPKPQCLDVAWR